MAGLSVQLQTVNGHYVCAEGGGGREVVANRPAPREWETFVLTGLSGLPLRHGHSVALQSMSGHYVYADGGGGSGLVANGPAIGGWEPLKVHRLESPGEVKDGDRIALQTVSGLYVYADGGGGGGLVAKGPAIGGWEPFTVRVLPPRHVRIELATVRCGNTEDVTGADELYLAAAGVNRAGGPPQSALVKPISINDGQTKTIPPDQAVVFDGDVEVASTIVVGIVARDEDSSHDWNAHGEQVRTIAGHVGAALAVAGPKGVVAGAVLKGLVEGVGLIMKLDQDDRLGETAVEIPVVTLGFGEHTRTWRFWRSRQIGYSTWDYTLTYRIFVS
ncbi:MAG: hypothetical protein M3P93_04235 [Actinomycetota bacterium]|nr:hypothetical protein [Actinomycetota bacterium]